MSGPVRKADPQFAVDSTPHRTHTHTIDFRRERIRPSSNLLKELRASLGLTQKQMGILLGASKSHTQKLETGTKNFPKSHSKIYKRLDAVARYANNAGTLPHGVEEYITAPRPPQHVTWRDIDAAWIISNKDPIDYWRTDAHKDYHAAPPASQSNGVEPKDKKPKDKEAQKVIAIRCDEDIALDWRRAAHEAHRNNGEIFADCFEAYRDRAPGLKSRQGIGRATAVSIWLAGIVVGLGISAIISTTTPF